MLGYRPLIYIWVAEFSDGTAIAQYDPETGKENKADPDWLPSKPGQPKVPKAKIWEEKTIVRFGWYPISVEMAEKIFKAMNHVVIPSSNPSHMIELSDGEKVIAYRENSVKYGFFSGTIKSREIVYILGKSPGTKKRIKEDGTLEMEVAG